MDRLSSVSRESREGAVRVGEKVGSIRIVEVLGAGGMGEVYVGFDETLQRRVAVKAISRRHRLSAGARARFLREARMLSQLEHPNICRIYDFVEQGDAEYLLLELIEGETLGAAIDGGLAPQLELKIARDVAGVLAVAHAEGIVHRDLKPGNVMLTPAGEVKVLDFGLARPTDGEPRTGESTRPPAEDGSAVSEEDAPTVEAPEGVPAEATLTLRSDAAATLAAPDREESGPSRQQVRTELGSVVGTPQFMSPEQARGEPATTASDMYSFGLLLQTLFTGRPPFEEGLSTSEVLARAKRGNTLPVTGLSADLAALIGRLKSMAPAARPTAATALERLDWIRDKPRRRARRLIAAAVLAVLALGGLKYTLDVRRERNVAEQRRGQAEDLIGFMLGDLRAKLEPVGRLEILDDVGERAMKYFASVPEAELSDEELLDRSKALYQIGEVRIKQGDLEAAEQPMRESLALAKELAERDADDGERLFGLGQSHFWVGFVLWEAGRLDEAREPFEAYLEVSERLVAMDPDNLDWQLELSYAHSNLGSLLEAQGDLPAALERFRTCLAIDERLVAVDPSNDDWQFELAATHNTVGVVLQSMGRLAEAEKHFRADLDIRQAQVEADPLNTTLREFLALSHDYMGMLLAARGDQGGALEHHRAASAILERLVEHDPSNADWRSKFAGSLRQLGLAWQGLGEAERALASLRRALGLFQELADGDPSSHLYRVWLAKAFYDVASARSLLGSAAAFATARQAAAQLEAILVERPGDREAGRWLAHTRILLGTLLEGAGDREEARRTWRGALELLEPLASGSSDTDFLAPLAEVLLRLDRPAEARPVVDRLLALGYRDPDFLDLCAAKQIELPDTIRQSTQS